MSSTATRNDFYHHRHQCQWDNYSPLFVTPRPHWLSTQPSCHNDHGFAKDISDEGYDNVYKAVYKQHNHRHGPWHKMLQSAQNVLKGQKNVRILDIGSGPGGVAAMLASSFPDADVTSAHSTQKCVHWASNRFHDEHLSNVNTRLVPDMENLDAFGDASFDLVTCCYGLSSCKDPQRAVAEFHRVLKPGGTLLVSLLENSSADIAGDIILKCAGYQGHKCEEGHGTSKTRHHFLENMLETANLSVLHVTNDDYPIKLGKHKDEAFKALTMPIRTELMNLKARGEYRWAEAEEAFEDILGEGFMAKQYDDGEMEIPYNTYRFVAARRQYEDGDSAREVDETTRHHTRPNKQRAGMIKPIDVRHDPVIFDTWVKMKPAASEKIVKAVNKQINLYKNSEGVRVLDTAPSPYAETAFSIASSHPNTQVVATSRSIKLVEGINGLIASNGLKNVEAHALDESHLSRFADKTFDIVISSFGLTFLNSPKETLNEFYRVLKPGGSLVISVWEDFSLQHLSKFIVNEMRATGSMEDFAVFDTPSSVLGQLTPYAKPHAIENMVNQCGFDLTRVDHETARILLSGENCPNEVGVNVATLPIRPFLEELEKTGENKNAFQDAKKAFEFLLQDPSLVSHDSCGNVVTTLPSRFKLIIATRPFTDGDGYAVESIDSVPKKSHRKVFKVKDFPK
ncbi:hypothetical protein ACHAXS_002159 [Conticribra weissflogii]